MAHPAGENNNASGGKRIAKSQCLLRHHTSGSSSRVSSEPQPEAAAARAAAASSGLSECGTARQCQWPSGSARRAHEKNSNTTYRLSYSLLHVPTKRYIVGPSTVPTAPDLSRQLRPVDVDTHSQRPLASGVGRGESEPVRSSDDVGPETLLAQPLGRA